jgi:hypothetical protein
VEQQLLVVYRAVGLEQVCVVLQVHCDVDVVLDKADLIKTWQR